MAALGVFAADAGESGVQVAAIQVLIDDLADDGPPEAILPLVDIVVDALKAKRQKPPSQNWRAFLENHIGELVSIDFFTVPTATFRVLFVLIVLAHDRRRIVHFNVTEHPTSAWTGRQMVEAFWDPNSPRYMIRDRDGIYGLVFQDQVKALGIEEVVTAP